MKEFYVPPLISVRHDLFALQDLLYAQVYHCISSQKLYLTAIDWDTFEIPWEISAVVRLGRP